MVQIIVYAVELMSRPSHNPSFFKLQLLNCMHMLCYLGSLLRY